MKRFLPVLAVFLALLALSAAAQAEQLEDNGFFYTVLEDGTARITGYAGEEAQKSLVIPEEIAGLPVTAFGGNSREWDDQCEGLRSLILPDSVTTLQLTEDEFDGAGDLVYVVVPDSVVNFDGNYGCFDNAMIIAGRDSAAAEYFREFDPRNVRVVYSDETERVLEYQSVAEADELILPWDSRGYFIDGDWRYLVLSDGTAIIRLYEGTAEEGAFEIPSSLGGYSVSEIGYVALAEKLKFGEYRVIIPEGVTALGEKSFYQNNITEVVLPSTLKEIGEKAFYCKYQAEKGVTQLTIPASVERIGEGAFYSNRRLSILEIPGTVKEIGRSAFGACTSLEQITIGQGVETIGEWAFYDTRCKSLRIPGSVSVVPGDIFNDNRQIQEFILEEGVKELAAHALGSSWRPTYEVLIVAIPASVELIDEGFTNLTYDENGKEYKSEWLDKLRFVVEDGSYAQAFLSEHGFAEQMTTIDDTAAIAAWQQQQGRTDPTGIISLTHPEG